MSTEDVLRGLDADDRRETIKTWLNLCHCGYDRAEHNSVLPGLPPHLFTPVLKLSDLSQEMAAELSEPPASPDDSGDELVGDTCPVCNARMEIDYVFTGEDEVPVSTCFTCGWPPPAPTSVEQYRALYERLGSEPTTDQLCEAYLAGQL